LHGNCLLLIDHITDCHPEQREGSWFLPAPPVSPLRAEAKIPRFARDDNFISFSISNHQYQSTISLNAFQRGIPDKLVQLQSQACWNVVGEHPLG
jgi:hypothetical protein